MTEPWLSGLLACSLTADAEQLRAALHARGLKTRSVPAGRAKAAWTCVTDRGTLAVVVSGRGAQAARDAAGFWMPRARWLLLAEAGPATAPTEPNTVILDGDPELAVLAARGAPPDTHTAQARIATVTERTLTATARDTLHQAGYAAWDANVDTWRHAVQAIGGVILVCHAVLPDGTPSLAAEIPDGATARPWWRTGLAYVRPSLRRAQNEADEAHRQAIARAARCAVAALLGTA
ncbi:MAG TPA: hypothetical protein VFC09_14945 [Candidatus Dormibacteraeota bacterium]|nr:hypothetical protein [Candidatus Dormibacteraeota bacterium]